MMQLSFTRGQAEEERERLTGLGGGSIEMFRLSSILIPAPVSDNLLQFVVAHQSNTQWLFIK